MRRLLVSLLATVAVLVSAVAAHAETVLRQDDQGRTIHFEVQAPVDVDWYANLLRSTAHGNEIADVTIQIVAPAQIPVVCGADAAACWTKRGSVETIYVPAETPTPFLAHAVVHEYGHHLDASWAVSGVQELNGTPVWWAARGMAALLASRSVAFDYSLGWDRSIGEAFAEDYAYVHLGGIYMIPWLSPPDASLKAALLAELGAAPAAATPPPTKTTSSAPAQPVTVSRSGTLAARATRSIPFTLLGPGRSVTFTASVAASHRAAATARVDVTCDGVVVATAAVTSRKAVSVGAGNLGPASCQAVLASTSTASQRYSLRLHLTQS